MDFRPKKHIYVIRTNYLGVWNSHFCFNTREDAKNWVYSHGYDSKFHKVKINDEWCDFSIQTLELLEPVIE